MDGADEQKEEAAQWRPLRAKLVRMSSRPPFTPEPQNGTAKAYSRTSLPVKLLQGAAGRNSPDRCNYVTATTRPVPRLKEL
jgi:hypothetical protein